jgi:phosphoribosylglycinamide formyltransferase-1
MSVTRIAIFASGSGTNSQKIIDYFRNNSSVSVGLIACNNIHAGVLTIATKEKISFIVIEREKFFNGSDYTVTLKQKQIHFIILAGFLWKLPLDLVKTYSGKIINIHPALLPKFGGKGMFGMHVHEAVIHAKEKESGISVHYVDEQYDHGKIIFQAKCLVDENETPESLANKIHMLEYRNYAKLIGLVLNLQNIVKT